MQTEVDGFRFTVDLTADMKNNTMNTSHPAIQDMNVRLFSIFKGETNVAGPHLGLDVGTARLSKIYFSCFGIGRKLGCSNLVAFTSSALMFFSNMTAARAAPEDIIPMSTSSSTLNDGYGRMAVAASRTTRSTHIRTTAV
jgi:hypothetical protein